MTTTKFSVTGVRLFYSGDPSLCETPSVQDVLFALQLSQMQDNEAADEIYLDNVNLVVAAVGGEIKMMEPYDESSARKMIAKAIVALCSLGARCLLNTRYVDAKIAAGDKDWEVTKNLGDETKLKACMCPRHLFKMTKDLQDPVSTDV
jgi:hypothetical protein